MLKSLIRIKYIFEINDTNNMPTADVLLVCHDVDRGFEINGKKYAQLLDSINERLVSEELSTVTVASHFSRYHGDSAFGDTWLINGVMARAVLLRKITRFIQPNRKRQNDPVVNAWLQILKQISPRRILGIQPSRELCIAAKKIGTWIADVQHGILDDQGYYGRKNRIHYDNPGWPDALLAWDEESANWINRESGGLVRGLVVGNPWHLRFLYPRECDSLVNQFKWDFSSVSVDRPILVTLSWGMERYGVYPEIGIPEALIKVIQNSRLPYNWWIRIHPVQLNSSNPNRIVNELQKLFRNCSNVSWDECTAQPLPLVLSHAALHITMMSATTIEAEWFGVKTALLYEDGNLLRTYLAPQISRGVAEVVPPEKESIARWIEGNLNSDVVHKQAIPACSEEPLNNLILEIKDQVEFSRAEIQSV